jgi:chromate transporter
MIECRTTDRADPGAVASLAADARVWLRVGCLSFGGPAGQIALMQRLLVDDLRWISQARFLAGLDLCMLLPGPEAQQLATYVGWTRQGWRGGVVAGGLFILPGALVMLALSWLYAGWGTHPVIAALLGGVQCAVVAIVVQALLRIGRRTLGSPAAFLIAASAFVALALLHLPFAVVISGAALAGLIVPGAGGGHTAPEGSRPPARPERSLMAAAVVLTLWLLALAAVTAAPGPPALLASIAWRFAELAVLSFGGAYTLLAALAEDAVREGWLPARQMADGLALAETTPGPLILVLQFVAFVAVHDAGGPHPLVSALLASLVALVVLFAPSFVWVFLAAPYVTRAEGWPRARRAVRGISAAVVGMMLHLSLWLALHVHFGRVERRHWGALEVVVPRADSIDPWAAATTAATAGMLFLGRQPVGRTLTVAAGLGLVRALWQAMTSG